MGCNTVRLRCSYLVYYVLVEILLGTVPGYGDYVTICSGSTYWIRGSTYWIRGRPYWIRGLDLVKYPF